MRPAVITCRKSDIRRIKIRCRCGTVSVAEVPQQVARALNLHPCPGCGAGFGIIQLPDKKWKVERLAETIDDTVISPAMEEEQDKNNYVGLRIRIVDATKSKEIIGQYRPVNPHPEHIGKLGTIIGSEDCGNGYSTPQIRLDDGTLITGAECWWEPVTM